MLLVLVPVVLASPRAAFAQATSAPQAEVLFAEGRELLEKGKFPEACAKLARSQELSPAVGTLLNLGYCDEQIGKLRSALDAYAAAETAASAAGDVKRAAFAKERYAAVEPRAPKLVVRLVAPEAPGLTLKRNGAPIARADIDRPVPVDPQDYGIEASAPGFVTWKGAIIVTGERAVVTIMVPPLARAPEAVAPAEPPSSSTMTLTTRRIAALGLGGLSALALGGGVAMGLAAKSRYDDASSHCDASGCDDTGVAIQSGAASQGNVATALVVLGLLSGGAGVYLWITGAPERQQKAARSVRLAVSPYGAALGGAF